MNVKNSIVPVALANTAEAEREVFRRLVGDNGPMSGYLESAQERADELAGIKDLESLELSEDVNALDIISELDSRIEASQSVTADLASVRAAYVEGLGVPQALKSVALALHENDTRQFRQALSYAFQLTESYDKRMPQDLIDALSGLGMPRTAFGRAISSYHHAALSASRWLKTSPVAGPANEEAA